MMRRLVLILAVLLLAAAPVQAVQVGWSVDVRQTSFLPVANDFHVWGVLESMPNLDATPHPPMLVSHNESTTVCDPFCQCGDMGGGMSGCNCGTLGIFTHQIGGAPNPNHNPPTGYVGPWPPNGPYYYFEANWRSDTKHVGFNDWAHFGLKFDVNDANYGYWLQGKWTKENLGVQTYAPATVPLVGFIVNDGAGGKLRLQNANPIQLGVSEVQLAAMPVGTDFFVENLTNSFFDIYTEITWASVPVGPGNPVPNYMVPDSFFDVFLESVAVPGAGAGGQTFAQLAPGQLILARQALTYQGPDPANPGQLKTETFWQYEMHEVVAPVPEPSTVALLLGGLGAVAVLFWRKRK